MTNLEKLNKIKSLIDDVELNEYINILITIEKEYEE
jgi:hypothetical protein